MAGETGSTAPVESKGKGKAQESEDVTMGEGGGTGQQVETSDEDDETGAEDEVSALCFFSRSGRGGEGSREWAIERRQQGGREEGTMQEVKGEKAVLWHC